MDNMSVDEPSPIKFDFFEFLTQHWKKYSVIFAFLALKLFNQPESIFVLARLFFLAISVIFLLSLLIQALQYRNNLSPTDDTTSIGEIHLFCIFQVLVIACLSYYEIKPDQNGITTLPVFLLCVGYVGFYKLLTNEKIIDKSSVVSAILILFILSFEIFLHMILSIQFFDRIAFDAWIYFWLVISLFSLFFAFTGGLLAYLSMFFVHYPIASNIQFYHYLVEEDPTKRNYYLEFVTGVDILFMIYLIPILFPIFFHP
jgi:hypothetical protein